MSVVIVGGGHAAGQAAAGLRQIGYPEKITIIANESHVPYQRPPLSKQYLKGSVGLERVYLRQEKFYTDKEIQCITGTSVVEIDPNSQTVMLSNDESVEWSHLVLATGSFNRTLSLPGIDLHGIHSLRTIDDADAIAADLKPKARMVVVGGGYIGLEVAATCRDLGLEVTVVELMDRLLPRVSVTELSDYFRKLHESHGVAVRTQCVVEAFEGNNDSRVTGVRLDNNNVIPADVVLVGVGIQPNMSLADKTGLECDNGIIVNELCQTEQENIWAIGDCTNQYSTLLDRRIRLECVPNAVEQARCVAANIAGRTTANRAIPWFWSDQYDVKFQMAGFSIDRESSVWRGQPEEDSFLLFHLNKTTVIGADAINSPGEFLIARRLIGKEIDPLLLSDSSIELKSLL